MSLFLVSQPDLNTIWLALLVFISVVFLPRYFKAAAARAREDQLTKTVEAYKEHVESLEKLQLQSEGKIVELQEDVKRCHADAAKWEARYHEVKQYTAQEAVQHFEKTLNTHSARVATRHEMMIQQGNELAQAQKQVACLMQELTTMVATLLDRVSLTP